MTWKICIDYSVDLIMTAFRCVSSQAPKKMKKDVLQEIEADVQKK